MFLDGRRLIGTFACLGAVAFVASPGALTAAGAAPAIGGVVAPAVAATTGWAQIGTLSTGGVNAFGIAVDANDDSVYVAMDAANRVDVYTPQAVSSGPSASVALPGSAWFLAIDSDDDTVYATPVTSYSANGVLWRIKGADATLDDSIVTFGESLQSIAPCNNAGRYLTQPGVNQADDTVYVGATCKYYGLAAIHGDDTQATNPMNGMGLTGTSVSEGFWVTAVDQNDDTVFSSAWDGNFGVNRNVFAFESTPFGPNFDYRSSDFNPGLPGGIVVDSVNDYVYSADLTGTSIYRLNAASLTRDATRDLGVTFFGQLAANESVSELYANAGSRFLVIDSGTLSIDDSVNLPATPSLYFFPPATGGNGLVYSVLSGGGVAVLAKVSATTSNWTAAAGQTISAPLSLDVASRLQSSVFMAASTVRSVSVGDDTAAFSLAANTVTITVPAGTGSVPVSATLMGGNPISLGILTYGSPNPPAPPVTYPPGPPTDVVAVAGDASSAVSWSAPADSGSFPISDYEVKASPGGASCLVKVPATTCTVEGLTNGTSYTFTVKALNGAGWGPSSQPSNEVTPNTPPVERSIVITGSRTEFNGRSGVTASGVTMGLEGAVVRARVHLSGEVVYMDGSQRKVNADGTFMWKRIAGKKVYVYFQTEDRQVRSNRIVIRVR